MRKFRLDFTDEELFSSAREKRLFFMVIGLASALVLLVLLLLPALVAAHRTSSAPVSAALPEESAAPLLEKARPSLSASGEVSRAMSLNAFVLPDEAEKTLEPGYLLFRPRLGTWDRKAVAQFWVPPSQIGLENLKKLNDKNIEAMLDGID
jgi:hypothetical protein